SRLQRLEIGTHELRSGVCAPILRESLARELRWRQRAVGSSRRTQADAVREGIFHVQCAEGRSDPSGFKRRGCSSPSRRVDQTPTATPDLLVFECPAGTGQSVVHRRSQRDEKLLGGGGGVSGGSGSAPCLWM